MIETAKNFYRQRQGNCAQAVAASWATHTGQDAHLIDELATCGSGRAPEGLCGALHAALRLVPAHKNSELLAGFCQASGGHATCRDIRTSRSLSCLDCVGQAAGLVQEHRASAAGPEVVQA